MIDLILITFNFTPTEKNSLMDKEIIANLVRKTHKGDKQALEQLCRMSEQFMRNYFIYKFKDENIVNDLCQETYTRLIKSLPNIREPVKYKSFVLKIAFHVMQDFFRKKTANYETNSYQDLKESNLSTDDPYMSFDERVITRVDVRNAIKKLPKKSQYILQLQSDGYKYQEIAKKLDLSESAIKMQIKRSYKKLNDLLLVVTIFVQIVTNIF